VELLRSLQHLEPGEGRLVEGVMYLVEPLAAGVCLRVQETGIVIEINVHSLDALVLSERGLPTGSELEPLWEGRTGDVTHIALTDGMSVHKRLLGVGTLETERIDIS
jgi:hypothetical protein